MVDALIFGAWVRDLHQIEGAKVLYSNTCPVRSLPYADQGYVDEDADVMGKMASFFGGGQKPKKSETPKAKDEPKKKSWPW